MNQAVSIIVEQGDRVEDERIQALAKETNNLLKLLLEIYGKKALSETTTRGLGICVRHTTLAWKPDFR